MELETKRLILRKPKKSDWKDIMEGVGEYHVAKMLASIPRPYKKSDAVNYIERSIKKWEEKNPESLQFMVELKSNKKLIGAMGLSKIDKFSGTANTGSWINKKYWRNGYITEAKIAINDFAFNKLKLRKLNSNVFKGNEASNATQKKMGYKLEGTKIKEMKVKSTGKIHDMNIYGLLKEDWKKARSGLIKKN